MVLMEVVVVEVVVGGSEVSAPPLRLAATRLLTHQIEFLTVYFARRSAAFANFLRQQACCSVIRRATKEAEVRLRALRNRHHAPLRERLQAAID